MPQPAPLTEAERARHFARKLRRWARAFERRYEYAKAAEYRDLADRNERYADAQEAQSA